MLKGFSIWEREHVLCKPNLVRLMSYKLTFINKHEKQSLPLEFCDFIKHLMLYFSALRRETFLFMHFSHFQHALNWNRECIFFFLLVWNRISNSTLQEASLATANLYLFLWERMGRTNICPVASISCLMFFKRHLENAQQHWCTKIPWVTCFRVWKEDSEKLWQGWFLLTAR